MLSERIGRANMDVLPGERQLLPVDIPRNGHELDEQLFIDFKTSMLEALSRHRPALDPEKGVGGTTHIRFGDSYEVNVVSLGQSSRITVRTAKHTSLEINTLEQQPGLHYLTLRTPVESTPDESHLQTAVTVQTSTLPEGFCILEYKKIIAGELTDNIEGEIVGKTAPDPESAKSFHMPGMGDEFTDEEKEAITVIKERISGFIGPFIRTVNETPALSDIHSHTEN